MAGKTATKKQEHVIELDAQGQILGRLATQVALYLQGKHRVDYAPHKDFEQFVNVSNVKKITVTGKKAEQKIYWRHSGYPGGIRGRTYEEQFARDPSWVLRHAVAGMLPKNRLQARRLKRLIIEE
jgi:large subunit ribosomal protein L13